MDKTPTEALYNLALEQVRFYEDPHPELFEQLGRLCLEIEDERISDE